MTKSTKTKWRDIEKVVGDSLENAVRRVDVQMEVAGWPANVTVYRMSEYLIRIDVKPHIEKVK